MFLRPFQAIKARHGRPTKIIAPAAAFFLFVLLPLRASRRACRAARRFARFSARLPFIRPAAMGELLFPREPEPEEDPEPLPFESEDPVALGDRELLDPELPELSDANFFFFCTKFKAKGFSIL